MRRYGKLGPTCMFTAESKIWSTFCVPQCTVHRSESILHVICITDVENDSLNVGGLQVFVVWIIVGGLLVVVVIVLVAAIVYCRFYRSKNNKQRFLHMLIMSKLFL